MGYRCKWQPVGAGAASGAHAMLSAAGSGRQRGAARGDAAGAAGLAAVSQGGAHAALASPPGFGESIPAETAQASPRCNRSHAGRPPPRPWRPLLALAGCQTGSAPPGGVQRPGAPLPRAVAARPPPLRMQRVQGLRGIKPRGDRLWWGSGGSPEEGRRRRRVCERAWMAAAAGVSQCAAFASGPWRGRCRRLLRSQASGCRPSGGTCVLRGSAGGRWEANSALVKLGQQ